MCVASADVMNPGRVVNETRDPVTGKKGLAPGWGKALMGRMARSFFIQKGNGSQVFSQAGGMTGGGGGTIGPSPSFQARKQGG